MSAYEVHVCREGYCNTLGNRTFTSACTITLICGKFNVLFDPGSPWDLGRLQGFLMERNLDSHDIHYVVCSHGHVDHVGGISNFPGATVFVGSDIMRNGRTLPFKISPQNPFIIDDHVSRLFIWWLVDKVRVITAPGHSTNDVALVVENTRQYGTVVVAGDAFESEKDLSEPSLWRDISVDPAKQEQSRSIILSIADYIVPGHGGMFKVSYDMI